jgi:hypothetical protein
MYPTECAALSSKIRSGQLGDAGGPIGNGPKRIRRRRGRGRCKQHHLKQSKPKAFSEWSSVKRGIALARTGPLDWRSIGPK